jgi:hypothetical protein
MEDEYEQPPDFCRFHLQETVFLILTLTKAALFTAIVTSFILEALPDLKSLSTSSRPSSILTISSLWFLSIMSSLAATTWAIVCLEWCAFLTNVTKAEDHEEMAEKRQCKLEAIKRWKMGLIVAAIPLLLHCSFFLFLAGLWLRLRDINKEVAFVVGVPSLVMVSTYVAVAFLPFLTNAPYFTSASELIELVIHGIKYIVEHCRFIRPPRLFTWALRCVSTLVSNLFRALPRLVHWLNIPHLWTTTLTPARSTQRELMPYFHSAWQTFIWFLPFIFPTYVPDPYPFNELNKLKFGRPDSNQQIRLRALFWLMNTPLSREEVKNILKEFRGRYDVTDRKPLDRSILKLLVSSISSLLENNDISHDEEPIFHHCTAILAEEIEKVSRNGGDLRGIYFWKSTPVLRKLLPHFRLNEPSEVPPTPSGEDVTHAYLTTIDESYWLRKAVPALLFCPLPETVKIVADQLDSNECLTKETLLRIVRGLHVATLACTDSNQSIVGKIPDLGIWSWDSSSLDRNLDRALLQFLQNLFASLPRNHYPITTPTPHSTTIPSLVVSCLNVLDEQTDRYPPKVHSALCLLVAAACRSDPLVFEGEPSFTDDLLASVEFYKECGGEGGLNHAKRLVARLRAIACGPKPIFCEEPHPLTRLGDIFSGLHESVKADKHCLKGFLDAYTATLEAVLSTDGPPATLPSQLNANRRVAGENALTNPFFTHHLPLEFLHVDPSCRLLYLYSLAIALTCAVEGWNEGLFRVTDLLVNRDENRVTLDRALDTNILVVAILVFAASSQPEPTKNRLEGIFIERLMGTIRNGTDWRTRWKSIYFIADLSSLLSQLGMLGEVEGRFLTEAASEALKQVKSEHVPSDWGRKKKGLRCCGLWNEVGLLVRSRGEARLGVYDWIGRHNVPYLSLYHPPPSMPQPILYAKRWALFLVAKANKL